MMTRYNFFNTDIDEALDNRLGPWFIIYVSNRLWDMGYDEPGMTLIGCEIALWFMENAPDKKLIVDSADGCESRFHFTNREVAELFNDWFKLQKFSDDNQGINEFLLWPTKVDFDTELSKQGTIKVDCSYVYDIPYYKPESQRTLKITKEVFDLFVWTRQNLKGKIWYWGGKFYFELGEDAMAFKLTHIREEKEDE